jgi:hypothetical protein
MCNLYLMVYSQVPFFLFCVNSNAWVEAEGVGGMGQGMRVVQETQHWHSTELPIGLQSGEGGSSSNGGSVQSMTIGQVGGVANAFDGSVWAFHRGERVWGGGSFDASNRITHADPIRAKAVLQLDEDSGEVRVCVCVCG